MRQDPDTDLLPGLRAGNAQALTVLMSRHLDGLHALAWHMTGDRAQAEDVVQETFLRFWQAAPSWKAAGEKGGKATILTWLRRVATRLCIDERRRKRPVYTDQVPEMTDSAPGPHLDLVRSQTARRVQTAMMNLPERQRAALVLSYYQQLSQVDGAAVLGVRPKAFESLLSRAKSKLRHDLRADVESLVI